MIVLQIPRLEEVHGTVIKRRGKGVIKTDWEVFWILFDLALYSKATDLKSLDLFSHFLGLAFRKGDKTKVSEIFTLGGTVLVFCCFIFPVYLIFVQDDFVLCPAMAYNLVMVVRPVRCNDPQNKRVCR